MIPAKVSREKREMKRRSYTGQRERINWVTARGQETENEMTDVKKEEAEIIE